ncbi:hypothetical protein H4582DRAFT_2060681 [Lactarius indigo]|nr:hypothetical protein H4582DRAFT_2060681 [Lactarius indigo]
MEEGGAAYEMQGEEAQTKELQSQKARIVAQMMPARVPRSTTESPFEDAENVPAPALETAQGSSGSAVATTPTPAAPKVNGFDAAAETLCAAFDVFSQGLLFRDPSDDVDMPDSLHPGSTTVTNMVWAMHSQMARHFNYISSRHQGMVYVRRNHTVVDYPEELKSKVYLLKHFEGYIMGKLYGDYEYTFTDLQRTNHDVLQIILSAQGLAIAHIDKNYVLTRWTLSQVMAQALLPPSSDAEQAKFTQRLLDKLRYCKEVLLSIRNASASASSGGGSENGGGHCTARIHSIAKMYDLIGPSDLHDPRYHYIHPIPHTFFLSLTSLSLSGIGAAIHTFLVRCGGDSESPLPSLSYRSSINMGDVSNQVLDSFEAHQKYRYFRILVIGRANAGKTTLLKRVCNTTEEPCIYDEKSNSLVSFLLSHSRSSLITQWKFSWNRLRSAASTTSIAHSPFASNPQFIFHDSPGFETGDERQLKKVQSFIEERARATEVDDQASRHLVLLYTEYIEIPPGSRKEVLR